MASHDDLEAEGEGSPEWPRPPRVRAQRARRWQRLAVASLLISIALCAVTGRAPWIATALVSVGVYLWASRCPRCRAFAEAPGATRCVRCGQALR